MSLCCSNYVTKLIHKNIYDGSIRILRRGNVFVLKSNPSSVRQDVRSFTCRLLFKNNSKFTQHRSCSLNPRKSDRETSPTAVNVSDDVFVKVKYNSILAEKCINLSWPQKKRLRKFEGRKEIERRNNVPDIPIALKYMNEDTNRMKSSETENTASMENIVLPFHQENDVTSHLICNKDESCKFYSDRAIDIHSDFHDGIRKTKDWLKDYEFYKDYQTPKIVAPWRLNYGTPNKSIPITSVQCGGCGAYLQCQDTGIPGYLPSELITHCTTAELRALKCQRCHFLEHYNMALNLSVSPEEYPRLLARIKDEFALVVLLVDLTDFPCSLWPGIVDIIGTKRPVIVVGNKVDLLPSDSEHFLSYAKSWLEKAVEKSELAAANIKHVSLVSAHTGFGVEQLITKLFTIWEYKGDVYLLGCTNVGKSTLFNTLLQSDYCKVKAVDIMQRATTSPWPGTTLNVLKFPIFRPTGWRLLKRTQRLQMLQREQHEQKELVRKQLKKKYNPHQATIIGHIGRTFFDSTSASDALDPFSMQPSSSGGNVKLLGLDPNNAEFAKGKWCYDTPGTIHPDQIIDILTAQELVYLLPREMILPRTFSLDRGDSVLIAGLGRLDFESGVEKCRFTVFAANNLPITVCRTDDVEQVYGALVASDLLRVPSSKPERLIQWPGLSVHSCSFEIKGIGVKESSADIVLSSAGWIAVTPEEGETCTVKAWTPFARGIHFRQPPLMRFSVGLHGKKLRKSPAYLVGKAVKV